MYFLGPVFGAVGPAHQVLIVSVPLGPLGLTQLLFGELKHTHTFTNQKLYNNELFNWDMKGNQK